MSDLPDLTFRGALSLLGHHDRPVLDRLNTLLGGVIMVGGAVALGAPAAAPLVGVAAMWNFVDQKNEALGLIRTLLNGVGDRRAKLKGYDRTRLIAAAHTVLVASAAIQAFREAVSPRVFKAMELTEAELADQMVSVSGEQQIAVEVFDSLVPVPSAGCGFEENLNRVAVWQSRFVKALVTFCNGLKAGALLGVEVSYVANSAAEIYRDQYREMAAKVPEFLVWTLLNEESATRKTVATSHETLAAALADQALAMSRLESVLTALGSVSGHTSALHRASLAELDQPVVPRSSTMNFLTDVRFPLIREIFIQPRYRFEVVDASSIIANEHWWRDRPVHDDLDVRLTAHLASVEATRLPMLVLGHPGAGKSLLMKVLAARLPSDNHTAVYVPLRRVNGAAPIHEQIDEALRKQTNGRVEWAHIADEGQRTTKVVILDGLDEMLQAAERDRTDYLNEVAAFQWRESTQNCPLLVIVTSRTLVIHRVHVPLGTTAIKLEDFDEGQVEQWRQVWNSVNHDAISARKVRRLSLEAVKHQPELAHQPLLLLMLALYSADPSVPPIDSRLSRTALYQALINNFARRETTKIPDSAAIDDQITQLSVAALGMFNRGRQHITDHELAADLIALGTAGTTTTNTEQRLVAQFFFVYTSEADAETDQARRSYEFLHATFGEYLVAREVVETLVDTEESAVGRRGARDPDDDRLFALLSHDCLVVRSPMLEFAQDLLSALGPDHKARIQATVATLIAGARRRQGSARYHDYRPVEIDHVREVAAYTANLTLLFLLTGPQRRPEDLVGSSAIWRSTLDLWRAGLPRDSWYALISSLEPELDGLYLALGSGHPGDVGLEVDQARLAGDDDLAFTLEMGDVVRGAAAEALGRHIVPGKDEGEAYEELLNWLVVTLAFGHENYRFLNETYIHSLFGKIAKVHEEQLLSMAAMVLKQRAPDLPPEKATVLVSSLLAHDHHDAYAYIAAAAAHPHLLAEFPQLAPSFAHGDG